jgi:beta-carotene 3-hydroxylase
MLAPASSRPYITAMLALILLWLVTVVAMEGFAYVMHRWVMHGPGWFLHESHHRARDGWFELNDLYAVIFAVPSIILLYGGVQAGWGGWATAVGIGIATYGAIYFGFHDVIVHRRLPHHYIPNSTYMKRIVQAHRLHHVLQSKRHGLSFGFLVAPPLSTLMARLETSRGKLREPARRSG